MAHNDGQRGGRVIAERRSALGDDGRGGGVIAHQPKRESKMQPERQIAEQLHEITRPAYRHGHVADRIFQNQIPADDPGDDLAQRRVGISVGRSGNRDHRGQLAVTERRESAGDRRDDKGKRHRRAGGGPPKDKVGVVDVSDDEVEDRRLHDRLPDTRRLAGGRGAGERENSRTDDRADAETGEIEGGQRALHLAVRRFRFADQEFRAFRLKKFGCHECSPVVPRWQRKVRASLHPVHARVNPLFRAEVARPGGVSGRLWRGFSCFGVCARPFWNYWNQPFGGSVLQ